MSMPKDDAYPTKPSKHYDLAHSPAKRFGSLFRTASTAEPGDKSNTSTPPLKRVVRSLTLSQGWLRTSTKVVPATKDIGATLAAPVTSPAAPIDAPADVRISTPDGGGSFKRMVKFVSIGKNWLERSTVKPFASGSSADTTSGDRPTPLSDETASDFNTADGSSDVYTTAAPAHVDADLLGTEVDVGSLLAPPAAVMDENTQLASAELALPAKVSDSGAMGRTDRVDIESPHKSVPTVMMSGVQLTPSEVALAETAKADALDVTEEQAGHAQANVSGDRKSESGDQETTGGHNYSWDQETTGGHNYSWDQETTGGVHRQKLTAELKDKEQAR